VTPLLVLMLDGIGADHVIRHPRAFPHLRALAARGLQVDRLASDVPATSLPGRTSIVTGVGAATHGVYGNVIWDGARFRYANPDDVRVDTIAARAHRAGRDVAVFGYGMIRPEDATTFHHAWWANEMLQRARDEAPIPADEGWLRTVRHVDASGRLAALAALGLPNGVPDAYAGDRVHYRLSELAGDAIMTRWTAAAATELAHPPDLILAEVLAPDSLLHAAGESHFGLWSLSYADSLVGELTAALERSGREATVMILSDHGHGALTTAYYLDALLPGRTSVSEGGTCLVVVDGAADRERLRALLAPHGITPLPGDHLPESVRPALASFAAPLGGVFEARAPSDRAGACSGPPRYASGHGFAPGASADDRFLVLAGPGIRAGRLPRAAAADVEATLATLLGIAPLGLGASLC
jgi:predicted AlkP superfamily pyrophosphatase or phosphodiesterase